VGIVAVALFRGRERVFFRGLVEIVGSHRLVGDWAKKRMMKELNKLGIERSKLLKSRRLPQLANL